MCLGVPMKILKVEEESKTAIAESIGVRRKISLLLLDDVKEGDWVMVHTGSAIGKLDEENAVETLRILMEMLSGEKDEKG